MPDRLENHSNEGKAKKKKKERGGRKKGEEKKVMVALLVLHWSLSFETPPFRGHSICSGKNVHTIFELVTSIEGTPLFGERVTFSGSRNLVLTFVQETP